MRKNAAFVACSIALLTAACHPKTYVPAEKSSKNAKEEVASQVVFVNERSFDNVLKTAQKDFKPIFIDFYADWCGPCKWLDEDVFHTSPAADYFNPRLVNVKINGEKGEGPALVQRYNVTAYPTMIYTDPFGNEIDRHVGMTSTSTVIGKAEKAVAHTAVLKEKYEKEQQK